LHHKLEEIIAPVESRFKAYQQILFGIHGLFGLSKDVSGANFKSYVESLELSKNYPEIHGISISYFIPKKDEAEHVAKIRSEDDGTLGTDFEIKNHDHAPVEYIEPHDESNPKVIGFDDFPDLVRKAVFEKSRDTHQIIISQRFKPVLEIDSFDSRFLATYPIYGKKSPHESLEQRRKNILGWAALAFEIPELMEDYEKTEADTYDLSIYDVDKKRKDTLIYGKSLNNETRQGHLSLSSERIVHVGDKNWKVVIRPRHDFSATEHLDRANFILYG
jgi:CHASE1-domain containing sensor protein